MVYIIIEFSSLKFFMGDYCQGLKDALLSAITCYPFLKEVFFYVNKKTKNIKVPQNFRKYFWDINFNELDFEKHRKFILERLLNYGTFDTFSWVFRTFSGEEIKELINNNGTHSLSRNSLLFWEKIAKDKKLWRNDSN